MSAGKWVREAMGILGDLAYAVAGWILIAPVAFLVPKRRDWIAVIGRENGRFLDNTKYFFIEASVNGPQGLRIVHVTGLADVQSTVDKAGLESLHYPSTAACWFLLRCGSVVVDSVEWCEKWRCFLLCRARTIQLWHGVGFKRIELDKWRNEASGRKLVGSPYLFWARILRKWIRGRLPRYDAVVTTSAFYRDNVFKPAFRSRHVLACGYPRNGFAQWSGRVAELAWLNVDPVASRNIRTWHTQGRKVVLVAPTFRDTRDTPLGLDKAQQGAVDLFCTEHGYEFLFKFHPYEHGATQIEGLHLHVLHPHSDTYPLFPFLHAMVTDYSSVYMDFLLVDRPIFFLVPDLEQYTSKDRSIQFDFETMTPGTKLEDWPTLLLALQNAGDSWQSKRAALREIAFDARNQSEATTNIVHFMRSQGWLRASNEDKLIVC